MSPVVERALPDEKDRAGTDARMRELLSRPAPGPVADRIALLHFLGRRTGRPYIVPAGVHALGNRLVVATGSAWRHNFAGGADGELTWRGERRKVGFTLLGDTMLTARGYLELYERYGDQAERRLGIVVRGATPPGLDDFREAVEHRGLSLVEVRQSGDPNMPPHTLVANERTPR
ncbi:hypothetical protein ACIRBZ_17130 [Streptomyces sp. NPDC094038]|uniref:hypothetical protein n=1 Tax=Streptomyces sp. NPDC094038 TaxID=3366055 RepID=UPI00382A0523